MNGSLKYLLKEDAFQRNVKMANGFSMNYYFELFLIGFGRITIVKR